ncbi:hypothetical protein H0B56_03330 [Haloechinothrix sp. YIM 98757]|uniref:DUF3558 domain-containing protein n=1 Tax=Haloechinothrix aidingensis TaxID=2752311 RepID=A0A838A7L9_9PSEU|nr:hypothetical protein [Haloechinothrix aidingensis]MBA0124567.1 hypothetical protein [Haloechinothrix aidingensis]
MLHLQSRVARAFVMLVSCAVVISACTTSESDESDLLCGVIDPAEARNALGDQELEFDGSDTVEEDPLSWECVATFPSGSRLSLRLEYDAGMKDAITPQIDTASAVSLGRVRPGMMVRDRTGTEPLVGGFFYISCPESKEHPRLLGLVGDPAESDVVDDKPGYRDLATVLTIAGNGVRRSLGCGGPAPLPDDQLVVPSDVPPDGVRLRTQSDVCGVFDADELIDLLPGREDGSTTWNVWQSPGDHDPISCQVWPDPVSDETRSEDRGAEDGPVIAFSRAGGVTAEGYDLDASRDRHDGEPWGRHLDGDGYEAQGEFRFKCQWSPEDFHVYVARYDDEVIDARDMEGLFNRWMHDRAPVSRCPGSDDG